MHDFRWPALITLGVVVLLFAVAWNVGRARGKYKVKAPATTGDPAFERAFRVQMNTLESAVAFLPVLWLFAAFVSGLWSAALGAVWLAARCGMRSRISRTRPGAARLSGWRFSCSQCLGSARRGAWSRHFCNVQLQGAGHEQH